MNNEKTKIFINLSLIAITSFIYASIYWLGTSNLWQANLILSTSLNRPWVYRQFAPSLARFVSFFGVRADLSLVIIVTLAGIGFYLTLRRLIFLLYRKSDLMEVLVVASVFVGMFLFGRERLPYDLMTAFLFTLAFSLLAEWRYREYAILFPVICFNRETAFLLAIFYFVILLNKKGVSLAEGILFFYQIVVWVGVRIILNTVFSGNGGWEAWVEPFENIMKFIHNPFTTILHLSVTGVLLFLVTKDWQLKNLFFRIAFVVFAPLLTVMYFIFGQAFEVRVFWEIYPVIVILSIPTIQKLLLESAPKTP